MWFLTIFYGFWWFHISFVDQICHSKWPLDEFWWNFGAHWVLVWYVVIIGRLLFHYGKAHCTHGKLWVLWYQLCCCCWHQRTFLNVLCVVAYYFSVDHQQITYLSCTFYYLPLVHYKLLEIKLTSYLTHYQNIYWNNISLCWVIDISYGRQYWFRGIQCPGSTTEPQDKLVNRETTRLQHSMDSTSHKLCTQFVCALLWLYHTFPMDSTSHKSCTPFCCALLWLYHTFPVDTTSLKPCTHFCCAAVLWLCCKFPVGEIKWLPQCQWSNPERYG